MGTKTIISTRMIHMPAKTYKPAKIDPATGGHLESGSYDVDAILPGKPATIDADEADRLIAKYPDWIKLAPAEAPAKAAPTLPAK